MKTSYDRILLKLSGEALKNSKTFGFCYETINQICQDIKEVYNQGCQICIVVGGGNICRGAELSRQYQGIKRQTADNIGMIATMINAILLQGILTNIGVNTRVQSAISMTPLAEQYIAKKAIKHMEKNRVVIFGCGIGHPFFTTDTAAVLRAIETHCQILLKGTFVDGVYDKDPLLYSDAIKYNSISYTEVINNRNIEVMDKTAITLAADNNLPLIVFNIKQKGALMNVINGDHSKSSLITI